ncbi:glycosyltransferase [Teichococcus vastitatis]|uniref:Glycosyltransferase n=1 Tax=Teichococcus vastitatis TaxID=2307076 RepID=A0ABS9W321_9PROT|nr:glycosyltransferase [Pseudoroseomonas vastitatis]MCI0753678.1 glycosyltransferase [Pseudoroseomonas vastitatis]
MTRCLWLARALPFPWTAGNRIYTAKLAGALAGAGVEVTFAGYAAEVPPQPMPGITWHIVPGGPRGHLAGLASPMPLMAARHETPAYHAALQELAAQDPWDAVIVDQYGMGWVLRQKRIFGGNPVFVFITHDHEESVTGMQWRDNTASIGKRLYLGQNYAKTRWFERWIARNSDLVTTITQHDAGLFAANAPGVPMLPLVPGYDGVRAPERSIGPGTPRAVVLFGSYRSSAKQANLRLFLEQADPVLSRAGVEIRVVGDMPADFRRSLEGRYKAARFTGFVDDPAPHLAAARMAVVAEPIGGGFKMKLLEYVFNRVPVAGLAVCASGLPDSVQAEMLLEPDMPGLLRAVLTRIDDPAALNLQQQRAFVAAEHAFDWRERGRLLCEAIQAQRGAVLHRAVGGASSYAALGTVA